MTGNGHNVEIFHVKFSMSGKGIFFHVNHCDFP